MIENISGPMNEKAMPALFNGPSWGESDERIIVKFGNERKKKCCMVTRLDCDADDERR